MHPLQELLVLVVLLVVGRHLLLGFVKFWGWGVKEITVAVIYFK